MSNFSSRRYNTYIDESGYARFIDSDIPVHRWAAEKMLGRKLYRGEVVHHKDRNKLNNEFSNLYVFRNQYEHDRVHRYDAYRYGYEYSYYGSRYRYSNYW